VGKHPLRAVQLTRAGGDHRAVRPAVADILRLRLPVLGALVAALALPGAAVAGDAPPTMQQLDAAGVHEIIVKRAPGLDAGDRAQARAAADVSLKETLPLPNTEVVHVPPGRLAAALAALRADPGVVYAEPNAPVHAFTGDMFWSLQWALENVGQTINGHVGTPGADIDAPEAWRTGATGAGQAVAVVDSGVNAGHPDLLGQMATNPGESGAGERSNGIDDDGDGLVDDWRGWDWVQNDNDPDDGVGHGSHVAGIIAARQASRGITGVAPDARIMALRVLNDAGSGTLDDIASAYVYAGRMGMGVVNASLGGVGISQAEEDAFAQNPDTLFVVAAGNGGADGLGDNNDVTPTYPCAAPQDNVVCVGATDNRDRPAPFSNYGAATVDLFAPGEDVLSAWKGPELGWWWSDGTSMAAPHVAATLALMRAAAPALDAAKLKQALLDSVDRIPALAGRSVSGGRLNAAAAVAGARALAADLDPTKDSDHDGVLDASDDCPSTSDALQSDADHDEVGNVCDPTPNGPDDDADGTPDDTDPTPTGLDWDGDGVPDSTDNCEWTANAGQEDSDGDGTGDDCDPTPNGDAPAAQPAPAPTPVPAPVPAAPAVPPAAPSPPAPGVAATPAPPALGALTSASGSPTVRLCHTGARGCRAVALTVAYRVDRAVAVTAQVQRRDCRGGRCRYVTAATLRLRAKAGANRLTIGARGATARLRSGTYRLRVVAGTADTRSRARVLSFRVR
jgi:thermitase